MSPSAKSPVEHWRYALPSVNLEGWAIIFIDAHGAFSARSDWGDVGYVWGPSGLPEGGFKRFLLTCGDDYLISKFGRGRRVYDPERSLRAVKEYIISNRREWGASQEECREEWELLKQHDDLETEHNFSMWWSETKLEEAGDLYRDKVEDRVTNFVKHVMPRLREVLRAELAQAPEATHDP